MARPRLLAVLVGGVAAAIAVIMSRHGRGPAAGRTVPGGILMRDVSSYDVLSGFLLGPLFKGISDDVAAVAPEGARVLEVGCGPGHLSIGLAQRHGLDVTGIDLDPAMIDRARANARRATDGDERQPSFVVGDVAALPFVAGSFEMVVSTFSFHHWADPTAGLAEIGRVLQPGGHALIWDLRPGARPHLFGPRHDHLPDPAEHAKGSLLQLISATSWRWPWRFKLAQRYDLVRAEASRPPKDGATAAVGEVREP